jgi:hypothetical protein
MGVIYTPPTEIEEEDYIKYMVFLAGSIEMDKAVNWQTELGKELEKIPNLTILNPRRAEWNSSWEQKIDNKFFKEQVDWELEGIENSDMVIFYFDPNTKSPITLLELGIVSQQVLSGKKMIICCPDGFYRKGNVDIVVDRTKQKLRESRHFPRDGSVDDYIIQVNNLSELKESAIKILSIKKNDRL